MAMIRITGNFPGANPKSNDIIKEGNLDFVLCPMSENKESFRLETKIENTFSREKKIHLNIKWPDGEWTKLKDCVFVKGEKDADWSVAPGEVSGNKTHIRLSAAPGETYVCLHPRYSYDDGERFAEGLKNPCVRQYVAGKSMEGRNIRCIEITNLEIKTVAKTKIFIAARNHAYETSGNYCVEGMINWLLSEDPLAKYSLAKNTFYFLPMTNPDGVDNGLDRLTRIGGADLNRDSETNLRLQPGSLPDTSHETFFRILDEVRPDILLNLHSYNFKHRDEIHGRTMEEIERFIRFMPDQTEAGKIWQRIVSEGENMSLKYCREKFNTTALLLEIPWFGRNVNIMRQTGIKIIRAAILMNTKYGDS